MQLRVEFLKEGSLHALLLRIDVDKQAGLLARRQALERQYRETALRRTFMARVGEEAMLPIDDPRRFVRRPNFQPPQDAVLLLFLLDSLEPEALRLDIDDDIRREDPIVRDVVA